MAEQAVLDTVTFETFRDWRQNRAEYAKAWKERTGSRIMGYFCTYAPEELIYAAGILPVRILGRMSPSRTSSRCSAPSAGIASRRG